MAFVNPAKFIAMKKALMPSSGIGVKALLQATKDAIEGLTGNVY